MHFPSLWWGEQIVQLSTSPGNMYIIIVLCLASLKRSRILWNLGQFSIFSNYMKMKPALLRNVKVALQHFEIWYDKYFSCQTCWLLPVNVWLVVKFETWKCSPCLFNKVGVLFLTELTQDFLNTLEKAPSKIKKKVMTWKVISFPKILIDFFNLCSTLHSCIVSNMLFVHWVYKIIGSCPLLENMNIGIPEWRM